MADNRVQKNISNYSVVILLIGIAIAHQFIANPGKLSPWKGGGFGMFSTIESPSSRIYRLTLFSNGQDYKTIIPGDYSREVKTLMAWPNQSHLKKLADKLIIQEWRIQRDSAMLLNNKSQINPAYKVFKKIKKNEEDEILNIDSIHLTIKQISFESENYKIKAVPLLFEKVVKHE